MTRVHRPSQNNNPEIIGLRNSVKEMPVEREAYLVFYQPTSKLHRCYSMDKQLLSLEMSTIIEEHSYTFPIVLQKHSSAQLFLFRRVNYLLLHRKIFE